MRSPTGQVLKSRKRFETRVSEGCGEVSWALLDEVFKPSVFPLGGGQGKPEYWAFIRVVQTSCPFTKKLLGGLDPTQAVTDKVHIVVADVARCIVRKNCSFPCTHDEVRRAHPRRTPSQSRTVPRYLPPIRSYAMPTAPARRPRTVCWL